MNKVFLVLIRALVGTGSRIAPKLTGRMAFKLFCTTFPPAKKSAKHQTVLSDAKRQFDSAKRHTISYSGGIVAAFEFLPDSSITSGEPNTIWLVHGWQSHSLYMRHFIEPFLKGGFRVISIDLPGHGQSSGRTFHLPLAVAALNAVIAKLGEFNYIVSHSLGGAVVATTLAGTLPEQPAHKVDKLVLISSPNSMPEIFNNFATMIGLGHKATTELHAMVSRLTGKKTEDFSTGIQLQSSSAQILLLHAPDDKEVRYSEAEAVLHFNPTATLKPMQGLGHRRIIASNEVVQTAVDFITASTD